MKFAICKKCSRRTITAWQIAWSWPHTNIHQRNLSSSFQNHTSWNSTYINKVKIIRPDISASLLFTKCKLGRILPVASLICRQFTKYQLVLYFFISCMFLFRGILRRCKTRHCKASSYIVFTSTDFVVSFKCAKYSWLFFLFSLEKENHSWHRFLLSSCLQALVADLLPR